MTFCIYDGFAAVEIDESTLCRSTGFTGRERIFDNDYIESGGQVFKIQWNRHKAAFEMFAGYDTFQHRQIGPVGILTEQIASRSTVIKNYFDRRNEVLEVKL